MGKENLSQTEVDGEANQISNIQQALQLLSHWKSGGDGLTRSMKVGLPWKN